MRILCSSDLHHDRAAAVRLAALARWARADQPVNAGDLASHVDALLARHVDAPLQPDERAVVARELSRLRGLVPGDFAAVARRLAIDGGTFRPSAILAELEAELRARGHDGRPIGF